MELFDTQDEIERRIATVRAQLEVLEEDVDSDRAMARLRTAHPFHAILVLRRTFMWLTVAALILALALGALPFASPELYRIYIAPFQEGIGMPLPLVVGVIGVSILIAWATASQAAVALGRNCPLLSWEKKERERLFAELSSLTRQRQMADRGVVPTYVGGRRNTVTPAPQTRSYPLVSHDRPPPPQTDDSSTIDPSMFGTPAPSFGTPAPVSRGPSTSYRTPEPPPSRPEGPPPIQPARPAPPPRSYVTDQSSETAPTVEREISMGPIRPLASTSGSPWLEDAMGKAAFLATTFPVQARLTYNADAGLPFTLTLERATPAMAIRTMMAYVEFLASIATPPRGRVELVSIPNLQRSFHRNVRAALEPYFDDETQVTTEDDRVEIRFRHPDPRWQNHPYLPG